MSNYQITGAGSDSSPPGRGYRNAPRHLADLCRRWLDTDFSYRTSEFQQYQTAHEMLSGIKATKEELDALVFQEEIQSCKNARYLGQFISAGYSHLSLPIVTWDISEHINFLGYKSGNIIVNSGVTGMDFASLTSGLAINLGVTGWQFGSFAEGVIINGGEAGEGMMMGNSQGGIGIDLRRGIALTRGESHAQAISAECKAYVNGIVTCAWERPERLPELYGNIPALKESLYQLGVQNE